MRTALFLALLAGSSLAGAQTRYLSVDLGTLGGATSEPGTVNNSGQVIGSSYTAAGARHAFLYANGVMHDLGTLPGDTLSYATDINSFGEVVGCSGTSYSARHAFLYSNGIMQDLGTLGGLDTGAARINDAHQITGFSRTSTGIMHTFLYSNGVMTDIDSLGFLFSYPGGINLSGEVAGVGYVGNNSFDVYRYASGAMQDLGRPAGFQSTNVTGMNDSGQIVGQCQNGSGNPWFAFLYSAGSFQVLGSLGGGYSTADHINNSGEIVGQALTSDRYFHGFIYRNGVMIDLNSLIQPRKAYTRLWEARGISDNGYISGITGSSSGQGDYHAALLVPQPIISVHPNG